VVVKSDEKVNCGNGGLSANQLVKKRGGKGSAIQIKGFCDQKWWELGAVYLKGGRINRRGLATE